MRSGSPDDAPRLPARARVFARVLAGLLAAVLAAGLAGSAVTPAMAQSDRTTWGVRPADTEHGAGRPNFVYELDPGDVIEDAIVVTNYTAVPLTFRVYAADGFTTAAGFLDLLPAGEASVDLGAWVSFASGEVTVGPDEQVEVPFTLVVPDDARPGDHSGGVVTSILTEGPSSGVAQDNRLGSRMHVRVPGDLHASVAIENVAVVFAASANPFAPGTATITYDLVNTGNVRIVARETVEVAGPFGMSEHGVAGEAPELLAGSSIPRRVVVESAWPLLRQTAEVRVHPQPVGVGSAGVDAVEPAVATTGTWAVSWTLVAVVGITVAGALGLGLRARTARGKRRSAAPPPEPALDRDHNLG